MIFDGFDVLMFGQLEQHIHAGLFYDLFVFAVTVSKSLQCDATS